MNVLFARCGWVSRLGLLAATAFLASCASTPFLRSTDDTLAGPDPQAAQHIAQSDEDDWSQLIAQLRSDLNRFNSREVERKPSLTPSAGTTKERNREFAARAQALFAPLSSMTLRMPVVGVASYNLDDSWHAPRDGGSRLHKGIDIFAPKGTQIVAVADGIISYIGDQPKGGHCLWLTTENGASFYYAHLDRWAPGMYEGMEVQSGDLLGFVGNTGNAIHTPSHLHFGISSNDEMINPYPLLTKATPIARAHVHAELGGGVLGTR